jgi:hypothetical protein
MARGRRKKEKMQTNQRIKLRDGKEDSTHDVYFWSADGKPITRGLCLFGHS